MTENEKIYLTREERARLESLGYRVHLNLCSNESQRALYEEKKQLGLFRHLGTDL